MEVCIERKKGNVIFFSYVTAINSSALDSHPLQGPFNNAALAVNLVNDGNNVSVISRETRNPFEHVRGRRVSRDEW